MGMKSPLGVSVSESPLRDIVAINERCLQRTEEEQRVTWWAGYRRITTASLR